MRIRFLDHSIKEILNSERGVDAVLKVGDVRKHIRVIFHKQYSAEDVFDTGKEAYLCWADCYVDDVSEVSQSDKLEIEGVDYNIESKEEGIDGWTTLRLTR